MSDPIRSFYQHFLSRDHRRDIERLNGVLGRKEKGAGFELGMPPVPFAGNPFSLNPSQTIAFFGLNPRWRADDTRRLVAEYEPLRRCVERLRSGDSRAFHEFCSLRAGYFSDDSQHYYGQYFTRAGRLIGQGLCGEPCAPDPPQFAKAIFRSRVMKADLLPWFSNDASAIDWERVAQCKDEAVVEYQKLILGLLRRLRPRWLQFNGLQAKPLIEAVFGARLKEERIPTSGAAKRFYVGSGDFGCGPTPILLHPFISWSLGRKSSKYICRTFIARNDPSLFRFC